MKIVCVFHSLALWGGIERILTDKMNWLAAQGHEVTIVTTDQGTHDLPYELDPRVVLADLAISFHHQYRYKGVRRLFDLWQRHRLFRRKLKELLRRLQPDVLVCTTTCYADVLVSLKGRVPLVVESHTMCRRFVDEGRLRTLRRWWLMRKLRRADVLVALTEGDAAEWRRYIRRVEVIPNMVHAPLTTVQASLIAYRVVFVGRLEAQKQIDHLVTVWRIVQQHHPDWTLSIYGDGSQREWLLKQVERNNLHINIFSPQPNIFDAYAEASVLVLTSAFEPFGLVMPEAMLCGLPVVAYDCPFGPRTIITDGVDGFLVPPDDIETFARRLESLMTDEPLRRRMGAAAISSARRFLPEQVMPQWVELFSKLKMRP